MVYTDFLNAVKTQMEQALGSGYELTLCRIPKNNGLMQDGLCITKDGAPASPAFCLERCYERYRAGQPLKEMIQELLILYQSSSLPPELNESLLRDFHQVKDRITCRLIHRASNREFLKEVPHISWLDLAIVFQFCIQEDENGIMSTPIRQSCLGSWNLTAQELYPFALANTRRLFPPSITSMERLLEELRGQLPVSDIASPFYILSNIHGIHGAACMLYPELLHHFSLGMEQDILILPSSIHEVLLLPASPDVSFEEMSRLVTQVNQTEVARQDRLSNQVYLYSRSSGQISLASCGAPDIL